MALIKNRAVIVPKNVATEEVEIQETSALATAMTRTKEGLGLPVNILRVEDPTEKTGIANYVLVKQLRADNAVLCEFVGFKIGKTQIDVFKSFEDIAKHVEKGSVNIVNIRVPWTRIISITNVTYKYNRG